MKTARLIIALAVLLASIVAIKIASSYKSSDSDVSVPTAFLKEEMRQVITPPASSIEFAAPASVASGLLPAGSWKFAGSATPKAAFESLFWAKEHLESTVLASLISVSPEVRRRADEVLASMTLTARSRLALHTPEALIAFLYATSPVIRAFSIGAEHQKGHLYSTIAGELEFANGRKAAVELGFRLEAGGWRYVLDEKNARDLLDNWQKVWRDHEK